MNKKLIAIIIIVTILILSILTSVIISSKSDNVQEGKVPDDIEMDKTVYTPTYALAEVKNVANMMTINNCIDIYINYICKGDSTALYEISIDNYVKNNNINKENILEESVKVNNQCKYKTDKAYEYDNGLYLKTYLLFGKIIDTQNKTILKANFALNIDTRNRTMEVAPLEKVYSDYISITKENEIKIVEEKFKGVVKEIPVNDYNMANIAVGVGNIEVMKYYFEQYILDMVYDSEKAYDLLDSNYKEKRFGNYEAFKQYVQQNEDELKKSILTKYKIEKISDYTEYLCQDNLNNCYIFKEIEPMNYTVLLDQYTINDQIFVESYNKKDEANKAYMNLNKFLQMLNRQDYDSAYNVLDDELKAKHFQTKEIFIDYISKNFFKYNSFNYIEATGQSNQFIVKTDVMNAQNNNYNETFTKRFNVDLLDDLKYKISFNI